jgi:hypothetical protein
MTIKRLIPGSVFAKTSAVTIAVLGTAYVSWFLYSVYVYSPQHYARNDANYGWWGVLGVLLFLTLVISTIFMSRYVLSRIDGRGGSAWKFYVLAVVTMLIPFPIAPVSPTTMIFFVFAWLLLMLNWAFGRSPERKSSTRDVLSET